MAIMFYNKNKQPPTSRPNKNQKKTPCKTKQNKPNKQTKEKVRTAESNIENSWNAEIKTVNRALICSFFRVHFMKACNSLIFQ